MSVSEAYVRARPDSTSPPVGLVEQGSIVRVLACVDGSGVPTACTDKGAWAEVQGGYVRAQFLERSEEPGAWEGFTYAKARRDGIHAYARPDRAARAVATFGRDHVFAFTAGLAAADGRYWERRDGTWVREEDVRAYQAETLAGEHAPAPPLAFFAWGARARTGAQVRWIARGARLPVARGRHPSVVWTPLGEVPRAAVRIAVARSRPAQIPAQARWVHVDLREQVLTAYEGDRLVFATLVSSGRDQAERRTRTGVFRVTEKVAHQRMHGEDYFIEEVPFILYFYRGQALHGQFWHHALGTRLTHGCVNLSLADAHWLFEWAPPALPDGWHCRIPQRGDDALWVVVEEAPAVVLPLPPPPAMPAGPPCALDVQSIQ